MKQKKKAPGTLKFDFFFSLYYITQNRSNRPIQVFFPARLSPVSETTKFITIFCMGISAMIQQLYCESEVLLQNILGIHLVEMNLCSNSNQV